MAVAIIGGTITSTLLTLLVVPTFYDSIEIARDRAFAKFHRRAARRNALAAFVLTFVEVVLALLMVRMVYQVGKGSCCGSRAPRRGRWRKRSRLQGTTTSVWTAE